MKPMRVTKTFGFDAGHRVPNHKSKCRNLHGHRYECEVTLEGDVLPDMGQSDAGMVLDFGDIKAIAMEYVHDVLDHAFIVYEHDRLVRRSLEDIDAALRIAGGKDDAHRTVVVPFVPTAENLARWIFDKLDRQYSGIYDGLKLYKVRLFETPNSWADAYRIPEMDEDEHRPA